MKFPSRGFGRPEVCLRRLSLGIVTVALWLASVNLPGPPVPGLDSWHAILIDAHLRGRQFGPEIVFTYGPWSFLSLSGYQPDALGGRFAWEIAGKLFLSATIVAMSGAISGVRRWLFLAAFVCGLPFFDNSTGVVIALLTLVWLLPAGARGWQRAVAVLWLSFFAHFKFVFCLQAVACVVIASAAHGAERRYRCGIALLAAFALAYLAFWVGAGQELANLPEFWRLSWEISSGYSWAMGLEPATSALTVGWLVVGMCGGFLHLIARAELSGAQRLAAGLVAVANWLLAWKHGFTRADGHVFALFFFCLFFGLVLPGVFAARRRWCWQDMNVALCIGGIAIAGGTLLVDGPRAVWHRWRHFPRELTHLDAWTARFDAALKREADANHDPVLASSVGRATVDLLNFDQGILLLNRLNYRPRPIPQSYSAYTPALLEANRRFFASDEAPDFVVVRMNTIDGRYPGQDDSSALAELARRYEVVSVEPAYVLLRRQAAAPVPPLPREPLAAFKPPFGAPVALPEGNDTTVWMEIDCRPTPLGRLRAFLYHAAPLQMTAVFASGERKSFRLMSATSSHGFFVRPFLESHTDLAALIDGRASASPRTVQLELAQPHHRWFWHPPDFRFFALKDYPRERQKPPARNAP